MKLLDNRLFKEELLYCEGKHKPFLRGKIHLASLVFFSSWVLFCLLFKTSNNGFSECYIKHGLFRC